MENSDDSALHNAVDNGLEKYWDQGRIAELEQLAKGILSRGSSREDKLEAALARHYLALVFHRRKQWPETVEEARLSNVSFFAFGAPQSSRWVTTNYYLVAHGMFMQHEWSEAEIMAGLSLKGGGGGPRGFGRPERILLLAKAKHRIGQRTAAREALERLLVETQETADTRALLEEARDAHRALS